MPESPDEVIRQLGVTCDRLRTYVARDSKSSCPGDDQDEVERLVAAAVGYLADGTSPDHSSAPQEVVVHDRPIPQEVVVHDRPMLARDVLVTADLAMRALQRSLSGT